MRIPIGLFAKATSVRHFLSIAVGHRHLINLFDNKTAFLNSIIDHEIYIEQPEGYEHPNYSRDKYVLHVNKKSKHSNKPAPSIQMIRRANS
jgi:Reverse transcriptase (RNA-dependent DNA polymerase)